MKELEAISQDKVKPTAQKQVEKQIYLTSIKPQPGHTCYEMNLASGELKPAEFESSSINFKSAAKNDFSVKKKIICKPGCVYVSALNEFNAQKKIFKMIGRVVKQSTRC